jgi:CRP-like cAMP-binding protein
MAKAASTPHAPRNALLARLSPDNYRRLLPRLKSRKAESGQVLHEDRAPVEFAFFPITAVTSYLKVMQSGAAIEVGTVGKEGLVGVGVALGANSSPHRVIAQVPGEVLQIEVRALLSEVERSLPFRRLLVSYQSAFHAQVSQSVACNGLHPVGKRCCRWLLMTHDRVGSDLLPLTHEFLSLMLGVRRASVTDVLGPLRNRGLIAYTRGSITIRDRKGMEAAACECYCVVRDEYDRLLR